MKTLRNLLIVLVLLTVVGGYYWFYLLPQRNRTYRLAPSGTVYLLQYISAPRPDGGGLIGFPPGTAMRVVGNRGPILLVSDGVCQAEIPRSATTDDLDVAESAGRADAVSQRRLEADRLRTEHEGALAQKRWDEEMRRVRAEQEWRAAHPTPKFTPAATPTPARR